MMKRNALALLLILAPLAVLAAGGEHEAHAAGVPRVVLYQVINVVILAAGIVYFTKDQIVQAFTQRRADYVAAAEKSAHARQQAEREFHDIKMKIETLEANRADTIQKAEAHAREIKEQIAREASEVSKRIREEATMTVKIETQKAQRELREQLVRDSLAAARGVLSKDIAGQDHQKLQGDFTQHIGTGV